MILRVYALYGSNLRVAWLLRGLGGCVIAVTVVRTKRGRVANPTELRRFTVVDARSKLFSRISERMPCRDNAVYVGYYSFVHTALLKTHSELYVGVLAMLREPRN